MIRQMAKNTNGMCRMFFKSGFILFSIPKDANYLRRVGREIKFLAYFVKMLKAMLFRTPVEIPEYSFTISHQDQMLSLGSCFAVHISQLLSDYKFRIQSNPTGIVYNPISITNSLSIILDKQLFGHDDLFQHQGLWHSFAHHGSFSDPDLTQCLEKINTAIEQTHQALQTTNRLILTLGTSFVYRNKADGAIVANCHKLPAKYFERTQLTVTEIVKTLNPILQKCKALNPDLEVIITISPIRHIRDGIIQNQRSKSTLLLAVHELAQQDYIHYFPAYEIMIDELRDYRFYARDMIHPSELAIDYILEKFSTAFFNEDTLALNSQIKKVHKARAHRSFHPASNTHQQFLNNQINQLQLLQQEHPELDWSGDVYHFKNQLI